ncbi:MAG: ATP-binding protein, partial [Treponema sp.]|nr:ATP-binding protein [Treponema sp.]
ENSPAAQDHILTIRQAGTNLLAIINDILDLSKIEIGKLEILPSEYMFSSMVNDVINIIKTRILQTRLRFLVYIDCNIPNTLYGDAIRIRQILMNLLSNSVKYTESGFVSLTITGKYTESGTIILRAVVEDSGKGMKKDAINNLFKDFTRLDEQANKSIEGTGLGLSITKSLITAMGGDISVESEYGRGSTFTVTLPQKILREQKLASIVNPAVKNVLIYERREIYADSIIRAMDNLGVQHKLVSSSDEFLENLTANKFSFVFLASVLYDEIMKKLQGVKLNVKFAIIAEFGEIITDHNISTLYTPVYCIPIANFLNGVLQDHSQNPFRTNTVKLTAPTANIMVVDDIDTNLQVAEGLLQPYMVKVKLCKSGMEALNEVKSAHYDLVFMDSMMPEMDGTETLQKIRALDDNEPYFKTIPVIALTANALYGVREKFIHDGFDDFLSKPIDAAQLDSILGKWIPKEKQEQINNASYSAPHNSPQIAPHYLRPDSGPGAGNEYQDEEIKIEGINAGKSVAMTASGGKKQNYLKMLIAFCNDGIEKMEKIRQSLDSGNLQLYIIYIHAIKSASANMGAGEISAKARALEEAGHKGDLDFIKSHNDEFCRDFEVLLGNIKEYMASPAAAGPAITGPAAAGPAAAKNDHGTDMTIMGAWLLRFKAALNKLDSEDIKKATNILQEFSHSHKDSDVLNEILKNVLTGDYKSAVALIDNLLQIRDWNNQP